MDWKEYQEKVAEFFRKLGAEAETNVSVKGARGVHDIDVIATFNLWGQKLIWICECKFWKTSIPKEKILTLYQITQDIGADRGFLFSEKGFQSGAVKATSNTNIILTSLEDVYDTCKDDLYHSSIIKSLKKINSLRELEKSMWIDDLKVVNPYRGINLDEVVTIDGILLFLSLSIQKALDANLPISFNTFKRGLVKCDSKESLLKHLEIELAQIEIEVIRLSKIAEDSKNAIRENNYEFYESVKELIIAGENALFSNNESSFEERRLFAHSKMCKVGTVYDALEQISRGSIKKELQETLKLLIDTTYLYLTYETINAEIWNDSKEKVLIKIEKMRQLESL
jgi:hypothetical protein